MTHPNFRNADYGFGVDGMRNGTVHAMFSGTWDAPMLKEALGDNLGAAQLPTIRINGQNKQLKAFAGSKAVGVNAYTKYPQAAMEFAAFITTPAAQKAHYKAWSIIPTSLALANDSEIKADPVAMAQMNCINNTSVIQPVIPEMGNYWNAASDMGIWIYNGEVTRDNAAEVTQEFESMLNAN